MMGMILVSGSRRSARSLRYGLDGARVVEADVPNNGSLRPGAFVKAEIVTSQSNTAVTVPISALVTFAGIEKVIVIEGGKAVEKPVTTGRRGPDWVEIKAGVNVGDTVVLDPGNLQSGQAVIN
mgnify:CR=1 FL=1